MTSLESFDPQFENLQLQQLIGQYPAIGEVSGDIRFIIDDDGRLGKASWSFIDDELDRLWNSGVKRPLMELFDALIIHRRQHGFGQLTEAHLTLEKGNLSLAWKA